MRYPESKLCAVWRTVLPSKGGGTEGRASGVQASKVGKRGVWMNGESEYLAEREVSTASHSSSAATGTSLPSLLVVSQI